MNRDLLAEREVIQEEYTENIMKTMTAVRASCTIQDNSYVNLLNERVRELFMTAFRITVRNPSLAGFALKTVNRQREAVKTRLGFEKKGIRVPPFMILSVTKSVQPSLQGVLRPCRTPPSKW